MRNLILSILAIFLFTPIAAQDDLINWNGVSLQVQFAKHFEVGNNTSFVVGVQNNPPIPGSNVWSICDGLGACNPADFTQVATSPSSTPFLSGGLRQGLAFQNKQIKIYGSTFQLLPLRGNTYYG